MDIWILDIWSLFFSNFTLLLISFITLVGVQLLPFLDPINSQHFLTVSGIYLPNPIQDGLWGCVGPLLFPWWSVGGEYPNICVFSFLSVFYKTLGRNTDRDLLLPSPNNDIGIIRPLFPLFLQRWRECVCGCVCVFACWFYSWMCVMRVCIYIYIYVCVCMHVYAPKTGKTSTLLHLPAQLQPGPPLSLSLTILW